jgi:hypothetical protein
MAGDIASTGNPGNLRVSDWLGIKAVSAVVGAVLFLLLFGVVGLLGLQNLNQVCFVCRQRLAQIFVDGALRRVNNQAIVARGLYLYALFAQFGK